MRLCAARRDTAAFQLIICSDLRYTVTTAKHDTYSAYNPLVKENMLSLLAKAYYHNKQTTGRLTCRLFVLYMCD